MKNNWIQQKKDENMLTCDLDMRGTPHFYKTVDWFQILISRFQIEKIYANTEKP